MGGMPRAGGPRLGFGSGLRAKLQSFKELHFDRHSLRPLQAWFFPKSGIWARAGV